MEMTEASRVAEPAEWFVVFHRESTNRVLSFLAFGEFKHVSAFGYCPGFKCWLMYDVQWRGSSLRVADEAAVIELTRGLDILKIRRTDIRMKGSARLGFYCVTAVKHLLGLKCAAVTPTQLYRHILNHGGISISESRASAVRCEDRCGCKRLSQRRQAHVHAGTAS